MKPTVLDIAEQTTFAPQERIEMGLDASSLPMLMSTLSNLYSDTELAVLRELSTNARDTMIAAGRADHPIEISLPGSLDNHLVIKDTGQGMSLEDLRHTYAMYGASTKRNSDEFNGILGLGSKSPFTYCDQYTVTSIKDGVKTQISVSRNVNGGGAMEVLGQRNTNEINGTTITIPTKRSNRFAEIAKNFFQFWKPGTVLVNGVSPVQFSGKEIAPGVFVENRRGYSSRDHLVMGNVAYPMERVSSNYSVVAFVEIGAVNFTPNREELHYTALTKARVAQIHGDVKKYIEKTALEEIAAAKNHQEAYQLIVQWAGMLNRPLTRFEYKGDKFTDHINASFETPNPSNPHYPHRNCGLIFDHDRYYKKVYTASSSLNAGELMKDKTVLVTGQHLVKVTPTLREKATKWLDENNRLDNTIVFLRDDIHSPWLTHLTRVAYDDIVAIKLPKKTRQRRPLKVQLLNRGTGYLSEVNELDPKLPIVYTGLRPNVNLNYVKAPFAANTQIIKLSQTEFTKLLKEYPHAVELGKAIADKRDDFVSSLTKAQIDSLGYNHDELALLDTLDGWMHMIRDKSLENARELYKSRKKITEQMNIFRGAGNNAYVNIKGLPEPDEVSLFDNYPLMRGINKYAMGDAQVRNEVINYLNANYKGN